MPSISLPSPVGRLSIVEAGGSITEVLWATRREGERTPLLHEAQLQLEAYFAGRLTRFDLPLAPVGSDFQQRVWETMLRIPYGETRSYGEVAKEVGSAPRAVGRACGTNPIPIVIPCHRILAAAGAPGGYSGAGGLATKRFLLDLERGPDVKPRKRAVVQLAPPLPR